MGMITGRFDDEIRPTITMDLTPMRKIVCPKDYCFRCHTPQELGEQSKMCGHCVGVVAREEAARQAEFAAKTEARREARTNDRQVLLTVIGILGLFVVAVVVLQKMFGGN